VQFTKSGKAALIATALITLSPAAAAAATTDATRSTTTTTTERDNDFPWGLLGLLGLAGLLGMRKKESDIHVDARRNH
jgi:hypothetical protein